MIAIFFALLGALGLAAVSVPHSFGDMTHKFQGDPMGGRCTVPGCGQPYSSAVHHAR